MGLVTDKQFSLDGFLQHKLDLMIRRTTKSAFDNVVVVDGDEGYGKSNLAAGIAYYVSHVTGRPFSLEHVFFDIEKMIDFAVNTEQQIIWWDEAALGGLSEQWQNKFQLKLIQMLMVARKKRHFFIMNIPKFFKLREYVILDRAIALVHVYARHETELGRFLYFTKKKKEKLYYWFKKTKRRDYKKFKSFNGSFSQALPLVLDEVEYDKKKDAAIMTLSKDKKVMKEEQLMKELQYRITRLVQYQGMNMDIVSKELGVSKHMLEKWKEEGNKDAVIARKVMLGEKLLSLTNKIKPILPPMGVENEVLEPNRVVDVEFIQNSVRDDDGVVSNVETTTQKPNVELINIDKPGFYISSEPRDTTNDANNIEDGYDGDDKDKPMPKDKFKPDEDEGLDDL